MVADKSAEQSPEPGRQIPGRVFAPVSVLNKLRVPQAHIRVSIHLAFLAVLLFGSFSAPAQEALRASLAGQAALDAKKRQVAAGWGDIRWGPLNLDLSSNLRFEALDNVRYSADDPQADLIVAPGLNVRSLWPLSQRNMLTLGLGAGYNFYVSHPDLDYLYITPDSNLSFDIYAGDFVINFHDRFHYTKDVATEPSLSGRGSYGRFDNNLGVLVNWDLNKALVAFNYDYRTYVTTDSLTAYTDHNAHLFSLRSAWLITRTTPLGVELGYGTTSYEQQLLNDSVQYSAGAYFAMPSGQFSSLRLAAGYVLQEPTTQSNTNAAANRSRDAIYAELSLAHQLSRHVNYTLSAGQQMQAGIYAQTLKTLYARARVGWNVIRGYTLVTDFSYEDGEEAGYYALEEFTRYTAGAGVNKRLSPKLTTSLNYTFMHRDSSMRGRNYSQNRLVLSASYSF